MIDLLTLGADKVRDFIQLLLILFDNIYASMKVSIAIINFITLTWNYHKDQWSFTSQYCKLCESYLWHVCSKTGINELDFLFVPEKFGTFP